MFMGVVCVCCSRWSRWASWPSGGWRPARGCSRTPWTRRPSRCWPLWRARCSLLSQPPPPPNHLLSNKQTQFTHSHHCLQKILICSFFVKRLLTINPMKSVKLPLLTGITICSFFCEATFLTINPMKSVKLLDRPSTLILLFYSSGGAF